MYTCVYSILLTVSLIRYQLLLSGLKVYFSHYLNFFRFKCDRYQTQTDRDFRLGTVEDLFLKFSDESAFEGDGNILWP